MLHIKKPIHKYTVLQLNEFDGKKLVDVREIAAHKDDISKWTGDMEAATRAKSFEKTQSTAVHRDFSKLPMA